MKRAISLLILLAAAFTLDAAPVSEQRARKVASDFFAGADDWERLADAPEGCYVFNLSYRNADGTFPYVHYRHRMDDPASAVAEKICCIMEARSGEIYLGSNGGGFYRANILADGGINAKNISTRDGLSNDRVRGFCEDSEGNIWISTEYGLNCYNPGNGSITPYYHSDGLANTRFHWNNSFTGTDGLLYFGHADGYTVLDPSKTRTSPTSIPVRLSSITIGDETRYTTYLEFLSIM